MTNSQLFKAAHAMAKQVHVKGESYQVTFGACLKAIKAELVQAEALKAVAVVNFAIIALIVAYLTNKFGAVESVSLGDIAAIALFIFNPITIIMSAQFYFNHPHHYKALLGIG